MVKFSVKKPLTVFVAVLAVLVLGVVAYLKMTPDLLPNMDFPYVVIVTTDPGASPEAVESAVTRPMEQSMSTLDRIKSVTSTSQDSVSMVVLEFEDGVNMDTVSVDIQQKINMLEGNWDDGVGTPYVLKINPSMLPVQVAAVSYSGKDVTELSDFVENTLTQKLEGISGSPDSSYQTWGGQFNAYGLYCTGTAKITGGELIGTANGTDRELDYSAYGFYGSDDHERRHPPGHHRRHP